jgi:hypothetical protein
MRMVSGLPKVYARMGFPENGRKLEMKPDAYLRWHVELILWIQWTRSNRESLAIRAHLHWHYWGVLPQR